MAFKNRAKNARSRGIPIALKALALCVLALIALLILLPAPPDLDAGGVTQVARHIPKSRDPVGSPPPATRPALRQFASAPDTAASPQLPPSPTQPEGAADSAPEIDPAPASQPQETPLAPGAVRAPEPNVAAPAVPAPEPQQSAAVTAQPSPAPEQADATPAPPIPARKPGGETAPLSAPGAQQEAPKRTLPWRIPGETAGLPPEPPPAPETSGGGGLPSASAVKGWVKSQAWEFLGGVDAQGNILYRFEVWLEAPQNELKGIKSVAYEYDAPSATPKSRETERASGGFRVRFGGLACAKEIKITLTMADGSKQKTTVDGCQVLN